MIIVWILTFVTFSLAIIWAKATFWVTVDAWGKGLWELLGTSMQICLMLIGGYVVASCSLCRKVLHRLASLPSPERPATAVLMVSLFAMTSACVHWGLSLMASAMLATLVAARVPKADFRLLVASAYLGLGCTWHAGLTGTAPLWANTPNNPLMKQKVLTDLIPQSRTIFTGFNLVLLLAVILAVTALMYLLQPRVSEANSRLTAPAEQDSQFSYPEKPAEWAASTRMLWSPVFNFLVVGLGTVWLYRQALQAANLSQLFTFDNTNFVFLMLGVALQYRPVFFLKAVEEAAKAVWGIIIQFPFYAGIFGIFNYTSLGTSVASAFATVSSPKTFPLITYWYTGIVNYFVPSGGSEWLITAPYLVPAAAKIGVPTNQLILAYSWGNMMTDMIQPFFAIPLLSVAKLQFREIMGYLLLVFLLYFVITSTAFWLLPRIGL